MRSTSEPQAPAPAAVPDDGNSHLMVPTDFSAGAYAAFRRACDLARAVEGRVSLVHVVEGPAAGEQHVGLDAIGLLQAVPYTAGPDSAVRSFRRADAILAAEQRLDQWKSDACADQVAVSTTVLEGRADQQILDYAAEQNVQLVVLPGPKQGWRRILSPRRLSRRIAGRARCPVMFVREPASPAMAHQPESKWQPGTLPTSP